MGNSTSDSKSYDKNDDELFDIFKKKLKKDLKYKDYNIRFFVQYKMNEYGKNRQNLFIEYKKHRDSQKGSILTSCLSRLKKK